jgi:rubredoxin
MNQPKPSKQFRCRYCGFVLPTWIRVFEEVNAAMLLQHLGQHHRSEVGEYLRQMHTDEDHDRVVLQAFEEVDEDREAPSQGATP